MSSLRQLKDERAFIVERLDKLRKRIDSEDFLNDTPEQQTLMNIQIKVMESYSQILLERLVRRKEEVVSVTG